MSISKINLLSERSFIFGALSIAALFIGIYVAVCISIDPFNIYHSVGPSRYMSTEQRLAKRVVAKSPEYDSYFIGSSMTEEFSIPEFNNAFHVHFAHLTLSGATSFEELNMLKQLPGKHYAYLVMEVYFNSHTSDLRATRYNNYPAYLYDNKPYNDFQIYLVCNPFLLKELYLSYYWNFRHINKDPDVIHVRPDGFYDWETHRVWDARIVRKNIEEVRNAPTEKLQLSTKNFETMLETTAPRFEHIFMFFPPINAESLRSHVLNGPSENIGLYLAWKKQVIADASQYRNVVLIDYQTINPYTIRDENYWDFNHFRSNINRMILEDFESWQINHRLAHPDFGVIATHPYGENLSPDSLYHSMSRKIYQHTLR